MNVYIWADTGEVCYVHERVSTLDPPPEMVANDSDFSVEAVNNQVQVKVNPVATSSLAAIALVIVASWLLLCSKRSSFRRRSFKIGGILLCLLSFTMISLAVAPVNASSPTSRAEIWGSESSGAYDDRLGGTWRKTADEIQQQQSVSSVINYYFNCNGYDSANSQGDNSMKELILNDISYNDANYPRVAVVDFDHGIGTTTYVQGEWHYMFEDQYGALAGPLENPGPIINEHVVYDMDIYPRTAEGKVFFAFINTCMSADLRTSVGNELSRQGIIPGTDGNYRARGMPFVWTHRRTDIDLSTNGYAYPDSGDVVYLGFPYGSAALNQTITGSDPIYAMWFRDFFWDALSADISVSDALDATSLTHFEETFGSTDLANDFTAIWPMWNASYGWQNTFGNHSWLAVYGNGNIHLYQKGGIWNLNENQGSTAYDTLAHNNDGAINGATWTTGKFGSALSFDGNDYVQIPDSDSLDIRKAITIQYWVKRTADSGGYHVLKKDAFGGLKDLGSNSFGFWTSHVGGDEFMSFTTDKLTLNQFHLITLTWEPGIKRAYIDGSLVAEYTNSRTDDLNQGSTEPIFIGNSQGWHASNFAGIIDEVRIYNYVFSPEQIADEAAVAVYHANDGMAYDPDGLNGVYAYDSSPYGNTGTFWGGASWTTGVKGSAFNFDGMYNHVYAPDIPSLDITNEMTVELWFKPTGQGSVPGHVMLVRKAEAYGVVYSSDNYGLDLRFGDTWYLDRATGQFPYNVWHHLAVTFSLSENKIKIYKNGNLIDTIDHNWQPNSVNDDPLGLGLYYYGYAFQGAIDEVRIYDRALSAGEISTHYVMSGGSVPRQVTVLATNQYSETGYVPLWIDDQFVGTTEYTYTMPQGYHAFCVASPITDWQTYYHVFNYYGYDSGYSYDNPLTLPVTEDETATAYYYSEYW